MMKLSSGDISERYLVEKCIEFDRHYQEIFYRKFADKMFRISMTYTTNKDEAADVLQEGFIKIFRKIHQFNFEGSLEGWVRKIIVNTALENYRKKAREIENLNEYYIEETESEIDLSEYSTNEIIEMVNHLPPKAQIVLKLYAVEGYSHQEISNILNISEGTSKSQLNRARKLLKEILIRLNGEY